MKVLRSLMLLLSACLLIGACEKENQFGVNEKIEKAFSELYPEVKKVEWERKEAHYVAHFWDQERGVSAEAWFDHDGVWYLTESNCSLTKLPIAIKQVMNSLNNKNIVAVDRVERMESSTIYIIELSGEQQNNLIYNENGELICQGTY